MLLLGPLLLATMLCLKEVFRREYFEEKSTYDSQYLTKLQDRHIIFVDGLLNEAAQLVGNYFCDNIAEAKKLGISNSHIGYLSSITVPNNADKLMLDIQTTYAKVKRPIILVGHSKGGAECLYLVLKYPELLLSEILERVVLIHPAVGGSPLADNVAENFMGRSFSKYLGEGLISIQPQTARTLFTDAVANLKEILKTIPGMITSKYTLANPEELSAESYKAISDRVFYVRGAAPAASLCWGVKFVIFFCKQPLNPSIPNDGLLHVEDQIVQGFGNDLGILECDHIDLVIGIVYIHFIVLYCVVLYCIVFCCIVFYKFEFYYKLYTQFHCRCAIHIEYCLI